MGEVVKFQSEFMASKRVVGEPTCEEIAKEYTIAEEEVDLKVDKHLKKSRIKTDTTDLLNAWEFLIISVPPSYISELKDRMRKIEEKYYSQDPEAS